MNSSFFKSLCEARAGCIGELQRKMDDYIAQYIHRASRSALVGGYNVMTCPILNVLGCEHRACNLCGVSHVKENLVMSEDGLICEVCNG